MSANGERPFAPRGARESLLRIARLATYPLERFFKIEAASGLVLIAVAALALMWANSPWAARYTALWNAALGLRAFDLAFERPLSFVVNDGLMTIFFFVAGMEIRREIHDGELSDRRRAMLPLIAALGGMAAPALIYLCLAHAPENRAGWGIPMATDIAFAVGALALLGARVPRALRLLLLTLAVADDLGAIVVIAIFYTSSLAPIGLAIAALGIAGIAAMRWLGVRRHLAYIPPAAVIWAGIYASGIHPTIAGVVIGFLTPVRARPDSGETVSPAEYLIEKLHPWVAFGIMPVFALANAGVAIEPGRLDPASTSAAIGIALGLVVGKPFGILLASEAAILLGIARMPRGLSTRHLVVLGLVAGIGFTMALFIAQLAFEGSHHLAAAKLGVLGASAVATIIGVLAGLVLLPRPGRGDEPR